MTQKLFLTRRARRPATTRGIISLYKLFPPSRREVAFAEGKRRRERHNKICADLLSLPQSFPAEMPAPSSEGAKLDLCRLAVLRLTAQNDMEERNGTKVVLYARNDKFAQTFCIAYSSSNACASFLRSSVPKNSISSDPLPPFST